MKRDKKRRKMFIFGSFLLCAVATTLYASALATQGWFEADCTQEIGGNENTGTIHVGLWDGELTKGGLFTEVDSLKTVCVDGECMWSCGTNKTNRENQFEAVKNHEYVDTDLYRKWCKNEDTLLRFKNPINNEFNPLVAADSIKQSAALDAWAAFEERAETSGTPEPTTESSSNVTDMVLNEPVFMDQSLWLATIVCLCFAMLWAIVGALFAVINTATTPVEWITGVGGLYVWNVLAVIFNVVCVSCWAAQFHLHLVSNVLLYDADANWTTQGLEKFGYSYWLVVVAIFIHIANIIIIYTGTYEPKQKQQLEAPDTKAGNIMLY